VAGTNTIDSNPRIMMESRFHRRIKKCIHLILLEKLPGPFGFLRTTSSDF
jgi:hypothetical protein